MESPHTAKQGGAGAVVPIDRRTRAFLPHNDSAHPALAHALRAGAEHLCLCGPRALAEFLSELAAAHRIPAGDLADLLPAWHHQLRPADPRSALALSGGRQFPSPPLEAVGGREVDA